MAYVLMLDEIVSEAKMRRSAQMSMGTDATDWTDVDAMVREFRLRLGAPLDTERVRKAYLKAVAG